MTPLPPPAAPALDTPESIVALDGPLTLATVAGWRPRLAAALTAGGALTIDPGTTTEIDGFGVQLLCSARRSAMLAARPFRFVAFPDALTRACARAGVRPGDLATFTPPLS